MAWYFLQTAMGCVGAVGFAILFNTRGRKLLWVMLGSGLCWAVYLACVYFKQDRLLALFFAAATAALISEVLARVLRAPVIILLVPILIPLIPGGDLYYMMSYLVQQAYESFGRYAQLVLGQAGAIALGIICVSSLVNVVTGVYARARRYKNR